MEKRDRWVEVCYHKSSGVVLLFPYVCYMAGVSSASGDAVELSSEAVPAAIGPQLAQLLSISTKADIDSMAAARIARLRRYWKSGDYQRDMTTHGPVWKHLMKIYPAIRKGPAAYLRQFTVYDVIERDGWKRRKIVRVEQAERGMTKYTEAHWLPPNLKPRELSKCVFQFLAAPDTVGR